MNKMKMIINLKIKNSLNDNDFFSKNLIKNWLSLKICLILLEFETLRYKISKFFFFAMVFFFFLFCYNFGIFKKKKKIKKMYNRLKYSVILKNEIIINFFIKNLQLNLLKNLLISKLNFNLKFNNFYKNFEINKIDLKYFYNFDQFVFFSFTEKEKIFCNSFLKLYLNIFFFYNLKQQIDFFMDKQIMLILQSFCNLILLPLTII